MKTRIQVDLAIPVSLVIVVADPDDQGVDWQIVEAKLAPFQMIGGFEESCSDEDLEVIDRAAREAWEAAGGECPWRDQG